MGLDTSYDNISEVLSLLQRYKQKIFVHNGDNYTNTFYNMIYLDVNNKVNIKKNKVKLNVQNIGIERRIGRRRKVSNKQKQQKTTWTGVSKLVYELKRQVLLIIE